MASVYKRNGKGPYYIAWFDHNGERHEKSSRTTDRRAADRIAAKREADVALRRDGVIDAQLDAICEESRRSIESHLNDFKAKMMAAGRKPKHVSTTIGYIRAIAQATGWVTVADISADAANRYAGMMKATDLLQEHRKQNLGHGVGYAATQDELYK